MGSIVKSCLSVQSLKQGLGDCDRNINADLNDTTILFYDLMKYHHKISSNLNINKLGPIV